MRRRLRASLVELGGVPALAAIALLVANDHLFKPAFHDAITGKLSDIAICFLLPLLLSAALGVLTRWRAEARLWIGAALAGALFAALEMSDTAGALFRRALALVGAGGVVLTRDPTDLLALACLPLAVAAGRWRLRARPARPRLAAAVGALALVGGSLALMADSPGALCDHYTAPVVFQAEPGCGPGGLIVVDAEPYRAAITIGNAEALGFGAGGPLGTGSAQGRYVGHACPFELAQGEWEVTGGSCTSGNTVAVPDAGNDARTDAADARADAADARGASDAAGAGDARNAGEGGVATDGGAGDARDAGGTGRSDAGGAAGTGGAGGSDAGNAGGGGSGGGGSGGSGSGGNGSGGNGGNGGNGGTTTGSGCSTYRKCTAALEGGELVWSCVRGNEQAPFCRSRLTVVP